MPITPPIMIGVTDSVVVVGAVDVMVTVDGLVIVIVVAGAVVVIVIAVGVGVAVCGDSAATGIVMVMLKPSIITRVSKTLIIFFFIELAPYLNINIRIITERVSLVCVFPTSPYFTFAI